MNLKEQRILVFGLGVTGKASVEALYNQCATLGVYEDTLSDGIGLKDQYKTLELYCRDEMPDLDKFDFILKSPGILPTHDLIKAAEEKGVSVVSDLELAYQLFPEYNIIGITGTNGKTTTTALVHHILETAGHTAHLLGNIGVGALPAFFSGHADDDYVVECSSFQLHNSPTLRTKVCAILNLTPDHVNWHGTEEAYYEAKLRLPAQQQADDYFIYNANDPILRAAENTMPGHKEPFSFDGEGYHMEDEWIVKGSERLFSMESFKLPGRHNLENALAAVAMAESLGVPMDKIKEGVLSFGGVAHRIERLGDIDGVTFFNDSKGTNVDASVKAIEAMHQPIRLLAGGMDKKISYASLVKASENRVVKFYLFGETKRLLAETIDAESTGILWEQFDDLEQATQKAFEESDSGDVVLLSPASASWDMYPNFEARGDHFRAIFNQLNEDA